MDKNMNRNLSITGTGSATGGVFNKVKIVGEGKISGGIECQYLRCVGTSEIIGSVKAETLSVQGVADIRGQLAVQSAKVYGETKVDGSIAGNTVELRGNTIVKGNCEAEQLSLDGQFAIDGLLNGGTVKLRIHDECRAAEIGGGTIRVGKLGKLTFLRMMFKTPASPRLTADTIEGDDIYLEHTHADIVRGNRVTIGPGCQIKTVEYKTEYNQHKHAKVIHQIKI